MKPEETLFQEKRTSDVPVLSGYQQLLACSARNIKKEIRLLCAGAVQDEVRGFFCEDAERANAPTNRIAVFLFMV